MLDRIELLIGLLGGWVVYGIIYAILKRLYRTDKKRKSIPIEISIQDGKGKNLPSNRFNRTIVFVGMGIGEFVLMITIVFCLIGVWDKVNSFIAFDLPIWMNLIGLIGNWVQLTWGTWVMIHNINYTPLTKEISGQYFIAIDGPYKFIRHPMYLAKGILPIFIFLTTGIWFSLFGLISWLGLPGQAQGEEDFLLQRAGEPYRAYLSRTGRFFPKIRHS
jgi:protein-S-isoprenylcysteine O-methyltransferase Ste14